MIAIQQIDRWIPLITLCLSVPWPAIQSNEPVIIVPCDLGLFLYSFALDFIIILNNNLPAQPQTWAIIRWAMVVMWWSSRRRRTRWDEESIVISKKWTDRRLFVDLWDDLPDQENTIIISVLCVHFGHKFSSSDVVGVTLSWVSLSKPQPHHITIPGNG